MAKFLFTMLPANDLGLPTRMVPIARALADRGHEIAVFNPAPAPGKLIAEAGLTSLPMPARPMPAPVFDLMEVSQAWDVEHFFGAVYTQEEYVRDAVAVYVDLMRDYAPDVVVDSFEPIACLAARILKVPLATVLQGNIHPASGGFHWWETVRPADLPSAAVFFNNVACEYASPATANLPSAWPSPCASLAAPKPPRNGSRNLLSHSVCDVRYASSIRTKATQCPPPQPRSVASNGSRICDRFVCAVRQMKFQVP